MTNHIKICLFFLFGIASAYAQEKVTLSGTIAEASSNETLLGVNIIIPELNVGTSTNAYGFYSITIPPGTYKVQVSYLGFKNIVETIAINDDVKKDFYLMNDAEELDEVVIEEDIEKISIKEPQMSVNTLTTATIKKIPAVLGEADVIKSILLLPGVSNAGEAASGFNVRGGAADQNLILLDEAIIFNSDHLFGFFSVFNPDAIKNIKLYKGGIPSRYGGRVSSVLDIYQKDGNSKDFHMTGGIGVVASRLLAEGPIVKDKGSFLIGGRSSYAHLFLKLTNNENSAYFYDLNTKLSYKFNDNNSLYLSGYFGRDVFNISDSFNNVYGNAVANVRWNHLFSDKLFSNLSLIYSDYYYGLSLDFVGFNWNSGIKNFNFKYDLKHYLSNTLKLHYGVNNIYYKFNPGEIEPEGENSGVNYFKLVDKYANEAAAYIDIEQNITEKLSVEYGIRFSRFDRLGQSEINVYENNNPVTYNQDLGIYEKATPIDTISKSKSTSIAAFNNLEPRLAVSYAIDDSQSVKASYNRMTQYLHLISNTSSPTPLDVWAPSGPFIKPQILDQVAIGYFKDINNNAYSLETEAFYKKIKNRIDYIDGADLIANNAIEQVILNGEAKAYGIEVLLKKNLGRLQGWLAYTLSESKQRTPGRNSTEPGINNGDWYFTPYDKTHDISVTGSYMLTNKWSFGANFIFQTGRPATFPYGQYEYEGINIPSYGPRNNNRLPFYNRLDLSATYIPKPKTNKKWQGEWVFSIYNVYNRKNAASITFRENMEEQRNEAVKLSIFGIVPSITYNFKF
ncbi:TonB-dependent receptor [Galbibacter pacificus]|uniref:isocitrate dehydrogenase (NADP(+)) n=1 Tax=Galbibacter pacificus TaxID=2996052 RepID=A0ABT6FPE4_9FLAO|nr:TonB-dependent receptor [Galbibacter pacificus]MDG3582387.1 TonB-dependent receptor [Galbibacter pacificus]MDG3585137.1 TonB-dependent receptor [Galbibacter pacificus]